MSELNYKELQEQGVFDDWAKINIENYCDAIFDGRYYVMRENSRLTKEKKNFLILSLNMGLKSRQVSAEREGYKLVPVEKLEELKRDADRMISSAHLYQDECHIKSFGRSFLHNYKAMIGAAE